MSYFKKFVVAIMFIFIFTLLVVIRAEDYNFASNIFSISTFLFGIFISFAISDRHNRIDKIRENDSNERASIETIYEFSGIFGKKFQNKIRSILDNYLMTTLDYKIWDYSKNEKECNAIVKTVLSLRPERNVRSSETFKRMLENVDSIGNAREQTIALIEDRLGTLYWFALVALGGIIIVSTLFVNSGTFISIMLLTALDFSILLLFAFLMSLDDLTWREQVRIFEPYQRAFESIEKMRYYPGGLILDKRAKEPSVPYRMAFYPKPYPDITGKKIKIIRPKRRK